MAGNYIPAVVFYFRNINEVINMGKYKAPLKEVICTDCGKKFMMPARTFSACVKDGRPFRCKECFKRWRSERTHQQMANMTEDAKRIKSEKISKGNKEACANRSEDDKKALSEKKSISNIKRWANMSNDERKAISDKISIAKKETWSNKSEDEKKAYAEDVGQQVRRRDGSVIKAEERPMGQ